MSMSPAPTAARVPSFAAGEPVFIIAEAGSNWRSGTPARDRKLAESLIDVAAEAGADAVKFQTLRPQTVYAPPPPPPGGGGPPPAPPPAAGARLPGGGGPPGPPPPPRPRPRRRGGAGRPLHREALHPQQAAPRPRSRVRPGAARARPHGAPHP